MRLPYSNFKLNNKLVMLLFLKPITFLISESNMFEKTAILMGNPCRLGYFFTSFRVWNGIFWNKCKVNENKVEIHPLHSDGNK